MKSSWAVARTGSEPMQPLSLPVPLGQTRIHLYAMNKAQASIKIYAALEGK